MFVSGKKEKCVKIAKASLDGFLFLCYNEKDGDKTKIYFSLGPIIRKGKTFDKKRKNRDPAI